MSPRQGLDCAFQGVVPTLLRPGGRLVLRDFHPVSTKLVSSRGKKLKADGDYFYSGLTATSVAHSKFGKGGALCVDLGASLVGSLFLRTRRGRNRRLQVCVQAKPVECSGGRALSNPVWSLAFFIARACCAKNTDVIIPDDAVRNDFAFLCITLSSNLCPQAERT